MRKYIRLFQLFFKTSYLLFLTHRFDFIMGSVANILWTVSQVITLQFLSTKIVAFHNWGFYDLILLLALSQIYYYGAFILYENSLSKLFDKIKTGDFDRVLSKPVNIKFISSFDSISVAQIFSIFGSCIPMLIVGLLGGTSTNLSNYLVAIFILTSGFISMYFLSLGLSGLVFVFEDVQSFKDFVVSSSTEFSRLPLDIFPPSIRATMTYVVPLAFTTYFPVLMLKGILPNYVIPLCLAMPVVFYLFQKLTWTIGLKHYSGVG